MTVSHDELELFTPHEAQQEAIDFILEHKSVLLKAPTGAGKTLVGVETAKQSGAKVILCIAPLNTESSWKKTVARQYRGEMPYHWINNRAAGKRAFQAINDKVPGWYFIGREFFRGRSWSKVKADFIIFDECHVATNMDSKIHKIVKTAKSPMQLAMSATPAGEHMKGIWALARWLWPKETPRGFWNWITTYFMTEHDEYKDIPELGIEGKKVTVERVPGKMWQELPAAHTMPSVYTAEPVIHEIEVELSPIQRKHYKELEEESITWLNNNPLAVDIPGVLHMRLRQLCLAVPSVRQDWVRKQDKETGLWEDVWGDVVWFEDDAKSTKIDVIKELLSDFHAERPEPVVIYTDSRVFATILTKQLQAKGYRARRFVGGMSKEERDWKKENFGVLFDVLVCTLQTVGEGTDGLQDVCNIEIWCNYTWRKVINVQAEGRLSRQGQKRTVQRYVLKAKDTVEVRQIGKLKSDQQRLNEGYGEE